MENAGMALSATRAVRAAAGSAARFVIGVRGPVDGPGAHGWAPLVAELQRRGFPTTLVSVIVPNTTFTPNATRAAQIVAGIKDVKEPVVILGVSNQGGILPLVAAARPVRRLVYVNACTPQPGRAFIEVISDSTEPVAVPGSFMDKLIKGAQPLTNEFLKLRADPNATPAQWQTLRDDIDASQYRSLKSFYEVCPLKRMPKVDNVFVSGAVDEQVNPVWGQAAARREFNVELVIIPGAGHANIVTAAPYAAQLADAAVRGL